jgi:hypothetical protein
MRRIFLRALQQGDFTKKRHNRARNGCSCCSLTKPVAITDGIKYLTIYHSGSYRQRFLCTKTVSTIPFRADESEILGPSIVRSRDADVLVDALRYYLFRHSLLVSTFPFKAFIWCLLKKQVYFSHVRLFFLACKHSFLTDFCTSYY